VKQSKVHEWSLSIGSEQSAVEREGFVEEKSIEPEVKEQRSHRW